ncbi:lytic transglycosylase domain-containing protein [Rudanella lutea]|uniref:lytic transglycosylase domain-containing protein n=1 Tax=Rudanella lutea TaxID=451374 RepID=UPI000370443A|nr:lytic transglycosylase domain-containing protein [Rudanella lutea]
MIKNVLATVTFTLFLAFPLLAQMTADVAFCGESLPDHLPAVKQRWFRILNRQAAQPTHLTTLKRRASVVFPVIDPIIASYGIPADFKFLPLLESAAVNRAVSRRGAAGFWQIMPETGRILGLRVGKGRDERYDLLKATHAACRYIKQLHAQLGSWMLVAAAYNAGPNYIQQLRKRYPDQHPMAMPYRAAETQAYVYQAMAIKELLTRPLQYRQYFSEHILAQLSKTGTDEVTTQEREAILASYTTPEAFVVENLTASVAPKPVEEVTLITDIDIDEEAVAGAPVIEVGASNGTEVGLAQAGPRLFTRRLGEESLTEGKMVLFEVVRPSEVNGQKVSVGDMLYAYVDMIEPTTGRVFLHTDRLVVAETQASINLRLVAVEKPKQPGVTLPPVSELASGWRLEWEKI